MQRTRSPRHMKTKQKVRTLRGNMFKNITDCEIDAEKKFGPQVHDCGNNFDFTLLFEEVILCLCPLFIALCFVPLRVKQLLNQDQIIPWVNAHYILKMVLGVSFLVLPSAFSLSKGPL